MKINLRFLVDFFAGLGKKSILILSVTAVVVITLSVISIRLFNSNPLKRAAVESENRDEELSQQEEIYSPALDDGAWVESLLARIEEERIAEELRAMEESLEEYAEADEVVESDETAESYEVNENLTEDDTSETEEPAAVENIEKISEVEQFFNEEKTEFVKRGKNEGLKYFEFENETFSPQDSEGNHILIHSVKEKVTRFFYNDEYLLIKKETWKIPSVTNAALEKTETYEYFGGSKVVSVKNIIENNRIEKINYNDKGKMIAVEKYAVFEKNKSITSKRNFTYDKDGRLLSDELNEYFYKATDYKVLDYSFTKKYLYTYNEGDIPPDFKYYENDVLKMYNKYSTEKGTYTSRIYFDEGMSVKAYYENDIRVRDVYYRNDRIIREKVYERPEKSEE